MIEKDFFDSPKRIISFTTDDLIEFEESVKFAFDKASIRAPIHLTRGNERALIDIFKFIGPDDWVFSTWRSHYHALLHGLNKNWLMTEILEGRSITIHNKDHNFFTSAIVGGTLPISVGVAMSLKRQMIDKIVWVFIGDMTAESGVFYEALKYSEKNELPIVFVVEDNGMSTNTPTQKSWGGDSLDSSITLAKLTGNGISPDYANISPNVSRFGKHVLHYTYERGFPHTGIGKWIYF